MIKKHHKVKIKHQQATQAVNKLILQQTKMKELVAQVLLILLQ